LVFGEENDLNIKKWQNVSMLKKQKLEDCLEHTGLYY
jgi:hypothetical protein